MSHSRSPIYATVTNDLLQDQRMRRICQTLADEGYEVVLIGRNKPASLAIEQEAFNQKRLKCLFLKGPFFYFEFNIRLTWWLLKQKKGIIWSVDTDTLLAATLVKWTKKMKVIWDAHEYFTEVPELEGRTFVKKIWKTIEKICVPRTDAALTVGPALAEVFEKEFNKPFSYLYNAPVWDESIPLCRSFPQKPILFYQGMLNEGRGLEAMIDAMAFLPKVTLIIAGEGDMAKSLKEKAAISVASGRILFPGWKNKEELNALASQATFGLNLLDGSSLSYSMSLANKFFDYMHAGLPSVNMPFAEYKRIIARHEVGIFVNHLEPAHLAGVVQENLDNPARWVKMHQACLSAAKEFSWQNECEKVLQIVREAEER